MPRVRVHPLPVLRGCGRTAATLAGDSGPGSAVPEDSMERALASYLLRREDDGSLLPQVYARELPAGRRAAFVEEAQAMLGADQALAAAATTDRVGAYRLLRLLGEGGTARVFEAEHADTGRRVAIKLLHPHLSGNRRSRARLCREARIARGLAHPGIVSVLECGEDRGRMFLVMDLVDGTPLHRVLEERGDRAAAAPGSPRARLADHPALAAAFAAVADALHAAHRQGVVHRDLKPSNLIVRDDGTITVLDFGLCSSPDARLTCSTDFLGTPVYMSPEQAAGRHDRIGPASDVYSLGAVLYECATGHPTVAPGSLPRVLDAVRRGRVPAAHRRARVAKPLSRILARCLAKQPHRRYPDAKALADDLRAFAAGRAPGALRSHWRRCLGAAALLAGAAALAGRFTPGPTRAPAPAVAGAALAPEVTRSLVELARHGDEASFARELRRVLRVESEKRSE